MAAHFLLVATAEPILLARCEQLSHNGEQFARATAGQVGIFGQKTYQPREEQVKRSNTTFGGEGEGLSTIVREADESTTRPRARSRI